MTGHDHPPENTSGIKPTQGEVAKKAYGIYLKEGRPQGHADENWSEAESQLQHVGSGQPAEHVHHDHHAHMAADFRKRFWISLVLALPMLVLSPMLRKQRVFWNYPILLRASPTNHSPSRHWETNKNYVMLCEEIKPRA